MLHRLKLVFALSLTLAAVVAAPAVARFDNTSGLTPTTTQPSPPASWPHDPPQAVDQSQIVTGQITTSHTPAVKVVRVTKHDDGFAWGDAAIGAGVAIGLLALIAGGAGASVTRRSRRLGESSAAAAS